MMSRSCGPTGACGVLCSSPIGYIIVIDRGVAHGRITSCEESLQTANGLRGEKSISADGADLGGDAVDDDDLVAVADGAETMGDDDAGAAAPAERGQMSHLLIDRFRFDSFAPDSDVAGSNLLTRFGQIVYLFFLVTPPHLLVERAWQRGRDVGRYKAVDDTLAHAVEAYSGMPELFFTWIRRTEKRVHFEFLDNTVPRGAPPRTAAFGWNRTLNVLDVACLLDIERFRKVDIDARAASDLYPDRTALAPARNSTFLRRCVAEFREVNFVEQATGAIYLHIVDGVPQWTDRDTLARVTATADVREGLEAAVPQAFGAGLVKHERGILEDDEATHTVGQWSRTLRDASPP